MEIERLQTITRLGLSECDLSPDGQAVAAVYQEDEGFRLGVWSPVGCDVLLDLELAGPYAHPCFDPDGRRLAAIREGEELTVWSLAEGKALFDLRRDGGAAITACAFGRFGETIAIAQGDQLGFWRLEGGAWQASLGVPTGIHSLRSSPDGRLLAVGLQAGGVLVIEWEGYDIRADWPEISQPVTALAFHPSEPWLLAAAAPSFRTVGERQERTGHGWAHLWNYRLGQEILRLPCDDQAVLLGQGHYLATLTHNSRSLWVWQLFPTDIVAHIENAVPELMVDEWGREFRRAALAATPQGDLLAVASLSNPLSPTGVLRTFAFHSETVAQPQV